MANFQHQGCISLAALTLVIGLTGCASNQRDAQASVSGGPGIAVDTTRMSSTAASPTSRSDIGAEYRAAREKWDIASGVLWNYLDSTAAQTTAAIATDEMAALMRRPEPSPPLDHILLLESLLNELPTLPESARTPAPGELQSQHYKLLEAIINATKGTQGDLRELDTKYEYTPGPATEIIATLAETTPPSAP